LAILKILKTTSGQYISWLPGYEIWAEKVNGGQSSTKKSHFSLNAWNFETDG